jgi:predicted MFS family arabinose efflux permease
MYGIGFVLFYYPTIYFVNEFWIERRGMAFGTMCASSALAGIAFPFTLEALLNKYGYPTTLRALAIGLTVMTAPVIPLLRGRLPLSQHESSTASSDWQCLKKPLFWVYSISNVIQGFGYFFPALFLPSYATATGLSASQGALLVALLSVAQALGQFGFGYASDRKLPLDLLILASTLVSAFAVFVFWYPARSLSMLVIFSLIYGFFGGAWISLWSQMGTTIYGGQPASTLVSISLLCFGAGIGSVAAGPMSARLTAISGSVGVEKYHAVIMFTGACMLASPITVAVWRVTKRRWTTN